MQFPADQPPCWWLHAFHKPAFTFLRPDTDRFVDCSDINVPLRPSFLPNGPSRLFPYWAIQPMYIQQHSGKSCSCRTKQHVDMRSAVDCSILACRAHQCMTVTIRAVLVGFDVIRDCEKLSIIARRHCLRRDAVPCAIHFSKVAVVVKRRTG